MFTIVGATDAVTWAGLGVSAFGVLVTVAAFGIAIWQVTEVRKRAEGAQEAAEAAEEAAKGAVEDLRAYRRAGEAAGTSATIGEVIVLVQGNRLDAAQLRIRDVQDKMIRLRTLNDDKDLEAELQGGITQVKLISNALIESTGSDSPVRDWSESIQILNEVRDLVAGLEARAYWRVRS